MTTDCFAARQHEALRQQLLLRALWRRTPDAALSGWLRDAPERQARALAAYRHNGEAVAARALVAAFPTVEQLVGEDSFAALARSFWRHQPPLLGDMACYGAALPDFIDGDEQLADVPYLADVARLDWALHRIEAAADTHQPPEGIERLGSDAPDALALVLRPGIVLIESRWPIVQLWQAHRGSGPDRFAPVREALAAGLGETALVWRQGWRPRATALSPADAAFTRALLRADTLAAALDAGGSEFSFETWLLQALQQGWLAAVLPCCADHMGDER